VTRPVSICVPTYNGARYLTRCLDSALAQTFEDFELVIVDDGSTDATPEIVRQYAGRDPRISVWTNARNLGLVRNWNRCVERASGAWVKFLFQDDLLEPSCLERMLQVSRHGVDLVVARRALIFEDGTPAAVEQRYRSYLARHDLARHWPGQVYISPEEFSEVLSRNPAANCIGEPTATLIRRSAFARYGRFNRALAILGDWEYAARVAANTGLCHVDVTLAHYRVHAGAASSTVHSQHEYRSAFIDPLIIAHELVYSRHYLTTRRVARRLRPSVDLRSRLGDALANARSEARSRNDPEITNDWRMALRRYPRLAWLRLGQILRHRMSSTARPS
jgi:glycosyltransferase involved in cell wall biosynthesis